MFLHQLFSLIDTLVENPEEINQQEIGELIVAFDNEEISGGNKKNWLIIDSSNFSEMKRTDI